MASVPAAEALAQVVKPLQPQPGLLRPTPASAPLGVTTQGTMDKMRSDATRFGLQLDGVFAGWLHSADGGYPVADVVSEKMGPDLAVNKHLGKVKYEEIEITFGAGMSKAIYDWITDSLAGKITRKNGSILAADYNFNVVQELQFFNALISEIGFPALDASSKDVAYITLKLSPEYTRSVKSSSKVGTIGTKAKNWLCSNFKLTIAGLDCSRVSKIDALVVKQPIVEQPVGQFRNTTNQPGHLEIPNLAITMAEVSAQPFYDWATDFVIKGNNGDSMERSGSLDLLSPSLATPLFSIGFSHLGIFRAAPEKVGASDSVRRMRAEMYCEAMTFKCDPSSVG